jgi:hypothetical protein
MTKRTFAAPFLSVDGVDLSDRVESLSLTYESEANDASSGGDGTRIMLAGLKNWGVEVTFRQDYAAAKVDATLFDKMGTNNALIIRPDVGVIGPTNPEYTGLGLLTNYTPLAGSIGGVIDAPTTWVPAGDLARDES